MIRRTTLLLAMTIVLLLSSAAFAVPDTTGAHKDTIAIQVLEERVKQSAEKTQIQVDGIQNEMRVRTEALEHRLDVYAGIAVLLMAFLSWFGYKTVKGWAKDRIEKMAGTVYEEGLADLRKRAAELTDQLAEEAAKAEKQRREIDLQAQEFFGKLSTRAAGRDKAEAAVDTVELSEYFEKLAAAKTRDQYTAKDWFLLAYEAEKRGNFVEAVKCYTNSIKLDPNQYWSYNNRGAALCILGRYDEALKALDKALQFAPERVAAHLNTIEVKTLLGQYDDALRQASKALAISKSSEDKAISLYLKCIAEKLLGKDTSATEAEFDRILEEEFEVTWSFDEIARWLEKADISEDAREFIRVKTALLKTKKKKQ